MGTLVDTSWLYVVDVPSLSRASVRDVRTRAPAAAFLIPKVLYHVMTSTTRSPKMRDTRDAIVTVAKVNIALRLGMKGAHNYASEMSAHPQVTVVRR